MSDSLQPHGLYSPQNSPGQNTGVGSHSLLQGIFPAQGSNPGLSHCRWILYQLSHQGNPRILEWEETEFGVAKKVTLWIKGWGDKRDTVRETETETERSRVQSPAEY